MKYQDIHLSDKDTYMQLKSQFASGQYQAAETLLQNASLDNKVLNAEVINEITEDLLRVQQLGAITVEKTVIPTSEEEPLNPTQGEVWFQISPIGGGN